MVSLIFRVFLHHLLFPPHAPKIQRIFKIYKWKIWLAKLTYVIFWCHMRHLKSNDKWKTLLDHFSYIHFENLLYFWCMRRKQKMMQENSENWGNQVCYILEWHSDLMHVMQSWTPYWATCILIILNLFPIPAGGKAVMLLIFPSFDI